jgi:hypothetical protein
MVHCPWNVGYFRPQRIETAVVEVDNAKASPFK